MNKEKAGLLISIAIYLPIAFLIAGVIIVLSIPDLIKGDRRKELRHDGCISCGSVPKTAREKVIARLKELLI